MIDDGHGFRRSLFLFLEGSWPWGRFFSVFILALVVLNLAMMIVTTVDSIYEPHAEIFDLIEGLTVVIFTFEYLARLYACVEKHKFGRLGPTLGRLRFMVTFLSIVDLVAIVPYYVMLVVQLGTGGSQQLMFLAAVRVLRVFRLLKLERLTRAFKFVKRAMSGVWEVLLITLVLEFLFFIAIATGLYLLVPAAFPSIPHAMYLASLMLVGAAIPDEVQLGDGGKAFVGISIFIGMLLFVLPTGVLLWGFQTVAERYQDHRSKRVAAVAPEDNEDSDAELFGGEADGDAKPVSQETSAASSAAAGAAACPACGHIAIKPING